MASGLLYQKVKPLPKDNTIINIMEGDRQRFLKSQGEAAKKMQKM